ncbi:MAG: hypothetical protein GY832_32680 [Chloroflexi bacterium]|nr:hypothetical protein [Chloroflexota bacterium]
MAPLITHLLVGERTFAQLQQLEHEDYGPFLLGCVLVDVHGFSSIDRRTTHFIGRLEEDGTDAFSKSCTNFLSQLDDLLLCPWNQLASAERAFVTGYLCHLAADEDWKRFGWDILQTMGLESLAEIPVPGDVVFTVFDVLSSQMYGNFTTVVSALRDAVIPNVLAHVPHDAFQAMWDIAKEHTLTGDTPESYFEMLKREGKTMAELQAVVHEHDVYWEDALALVHDLGGVEPRIQGGVQRSLEVIPHLWA